MTTDLKKHIDAQADLCKKLNVDFVPADNDLNVGLADNVTSDSQPIHGLRHPLAEGTTGWFVWAGEYSDAPDFFKPQCLKHLLDIRPDIIKYFALPPGHRFLVDNNGYEDIWFDRQLLDI